MALQKYVPSGDGPSMRIKPLSFSSKVSRDAQPMDPETSNIVEPDVDIDLREVYFLIMHFLSAGPCHRTYGQLWNELLEHQLLPRRYHAWYSRSGAPTGDENDDGISFPLSYNKLVERYPHVEKDHLVKLLKQLLLNATSPSHGITGGRVPNAADVPTLLGVGSFSLLKCDRENGNTGIKRPPVHMHWPHMHADQVRGLGLREIGGGFTRHHRAPSIRAACYAIAKPSTMVQRMQNVKRLRGHRNAVYCAIFDRTGRYVITGSDDRLVKIWSMEMAYCLASCRGHEGDITDLAVSSNNALVASSSNDCIIRVWRLPDGLPISVLRGHTGAVTAIAFSPRPSSVYQLLSSSDDGTCRIWDARNSQFPPRIYAPRPSDSIAARNSGPSVASQNHQIFCCAFNASGSVFVTGSSDTLARVWSAYKPIADIADQPIHEIDVLSGHENDVNYVQFSGCAVASRFSVADNSKEENTPKFKNFWYSHDNIVTCSRDGSAIIWIPRSRRSHGKVGRWVRAYHLKVPPPPMPPQPPRGGPRQRILPTPRGVNMIVWSLDNRFVLAAIMDCRICVWNAADGSLVHSLTGHTASTYVLDVHPFNPRIAMSAGYDGKTIVWDIWEGMPIQIYEISRFRLVDGKFSSDGTSIILSDDVGQLYILSTGQGESQKDAKYDQFFLGDYRPLVQDTYGNVLDQETQLAPYRRNMQDLLCDSAMIPYPEPYQSMYQKRRLGALGIEWRPSSLRLAVGPDFSVDHGYQMLPLADLDVLIDPLPEFIDVMDWEPENEVQSDDNDSEYNVPEEYSTGGEQASMSSNASDDPECSAEDSEFIDAHKDGLRRSKRKKEKSDIEIMTSSGRRIKRRNLDECDGSPLRSMRSRKSRKSQKTSRKKSKSTSLRPQRAAARNALSLFSKITGTSTDGEEEDVSEGDTSESESSLQDLNSETDDSDRSLEDEHSKNSKRKQIVLDKHGNAVENNEVPGSHSNVGNGTTRLILKFPVRDSAKHMPSDSTVQECKRTNLVGSSSKAPVESVKLNRNHFSTLDMGKSCAEADLSLMGRERGNPDKAEDFAKLSQGYKNGNIRWGGVKARTTKRVKLGETMSWDIFGRSGVGHDNHLKTKGEINGYLKLRKDCGGASSSLAVPANGGSMDAFESMYAKNNEAGTSLGLNGIDPCDEKEKLSFSESRARSTKDVATSSSHCEGGLGNPPEVKGSTAPILMKFKIRSNRSTMDSDSPSSPKLQSRMGDPVNGDSAHGSPAVRIAAQSNEIEKTDEEHGHYKSQESDTVPALDEIPEARMQSKKMFSAVYRRSRTHRGRSHLDNDNGKMEEGTSNSDLNTSAAADTHQGLSNVNFRMDSIGPRLTSDPNGVSKERCDEQLEVAIRSAPSISFSRGQPPCEELVESTGMAVGLRSTRTRRGNYYIRDTNPKERKRSSHSGRKGSWLMLSTHVEGSPYIPQQGDEVVYLRQGHEEYLNHIQSRELSPCTSLGGDIRAVEFCKVEDLEYSTLPGSGDSCCKIILKFIDPNSSVFRKTFKLTLPEVTGFPDFLVERSRFDAAMQKNWTCRDKCRIWWKNETDDNGSWWEGRITAVKPKSPEFPDSPWERYTVMYKSDPPETHRHSPWEFYDPDTLWQQPHLDVECRDKLLSAFAKLERSGGPQDRYGIQKLNQVSQRSNFTNRFPVPLSVDVIQSRLENSYYRRLEALKHDISVVLSNAESYFERNAEVLPKVKRLSDWFTRILSTL